MTTKDTKPQKTPFFVGAFFYEDLRGDLRAAMRFTFKNTAERAVCRSLLRLANLADKNPVPWSLQDWEFWQGNAMGNVYAILQPPKNTSVPNLFS